MQEAGEHLKELTVVGSREFRRTQWLPNSAVCEERV